MNFFEVLKNDLQNVNLDIKDSTGKWNDRQKRLKSFLLSDNSENFLNCDVINESMFHEPNVLEFLDIKNDNWEFWEPGLFEKWVGNPRKSNHYDSSGNLIHHAYSFKQMVSKSSISLSNINSIFELGGGYGSFCRMIYQLGYEKDYSLYDLPVFMALQKYFLNRNGFNDKIENGKINFFQDLEEIENHKNIDLFVSLWAFSECPIDFRNKLFSILEKKNLKYILIAYQKEFENIDNLKYFQEFKENYNYKWSEFEIKHIPENYYLIGELL